MLTKQIKSITQHNPRPDSIVNANSQGLSSGGLHFGENGEDVIHTKRSKVSLSDKSKEYPHQD